MTLGFFPSVLISLAFLTLNVLLLLWVLLVYV